MSNHDIGYAMADVVEPMMEEYEKKNIDKTTVKRMLHIMENVVGGQDGNTPEMYIDFDTERCACCLKRKDQSELADWPEIVSDRIGMWQYKEMNIIENELDLTGDMICPDCRKKLDKMLDAICKEREKEKKEKEE